MASVCSLGSRGRLHLRLVLLAQTILYFGSAFGPFKSPEIVGALVGILFLPYVITLFLVVDDWQDQRAAACAKP